MSYRINSSTLKNSLLRAATSCVLIVLFALSLSGCTNHPEHTGPDESNLSVEATSPVKPPMNDGDDDKQGNDEDAHTELEEAGEEQDDPNSATAPNTQDTQAQTGFGASASNATGGSSNAGNSTANSGSSSSNTGSSSAGSGSGSGSGGSSGSGDSSSTAASGSGGGQSSSGSGGSTQSSGQGQSQSGGSGTNSSSGSSGTNSSGSSSNSAQNTAPQTITVSIEICARLAYAADPAAVAGITSSGTILSRRSVTVPVDASVRQALDATGVRLNARGAYIAGIAGLSEGDLGQQSGWMFSVNGAFSSQSASAHRLSAGDVIAWRYTINGGADLGASW